MDADRASYQRLATSTGAPAFKMPSAMSTASRRSTATTAAPPPPALPSFLPPPPPSLSLTSSFPSVSSSPASAPAPPRISETITWEYPTPRIPPAAAAASAADVPTRAACPPPKEVFAPPRPRPLAPPAAASSRNDVLGGAGDEGTIPLNLPRPLPTSSSSRPRSPPPFRPPPASAPVSSGGIVPISWQPEEQQDERSLPAASSQWSQQPVKRASPVSQQMGPPQQIPTLAKAPTAPLLQHPPARPASSQPTAPPSFIDLCGRRIDFSVPPPTLEAPSLPPPVKGWGAGGDDGSPDRRYESKRRSYSPPRHLRSLSPKFSSRRRRDRRSPSPPRSRSSRRTNSPDRRRPPPRRRTRTRSQSRSRSRSPPPRRRRPSSPRRSGSPLEFRGRKTGRYMREMHNMLFRPYDHPIFAGSDVEEATMQSLIISVKMRMEGGAMHERTEKVSKLPWCVLVVVGAGDSTLNQVAERFAKEFGKEKVVSIRDPSEEAWESRPVHRSALVTSGKSLVVTNGFFPLADREVRFVIGVGVPWVGFEGTPKLMDLWCDMLDDVVDEMGHTSRRLVQTDVWVDMSHKNQVAGIHEWFYKKGGGGKVEEDLSKRFEQAAQEFRASLGAPLALPTFKKASDALSYAKSVAAKVHQETHSK